MLSNTDLPGQSPQPPRNLPGDIPEAVRETPDIQPQSQGKQRWLIAGGSLSAIALVLGIWLVGQAQKAPSSNPVSSVPGNPVANTPIPSATPGENVDNLLGHLPYPEAPASELVALSMDGSIQLRRSAAAAFEDMVAAAQADGIAIVPLSGFRSLSDQQHVFFDVKAEREQSAQQRAEVSAPPGYSEHHTGYAIDVGDPNAPGTHLSQSFEETAAFQWLQRNAARFNFEISFPPNNPQGVSYEPWHWRFIGDRNSLETFYKARNLPGNNSSSPSP